jgi:polyvinyl alcohol dehydrogenase (cytochrome)
LEFILANAVLLFALGFASGTPAVRPDGAALFQASCSTCHREGSGTTAPLPDQLRRMTRGSILRDLETGRMKEEAAQLTGEERSAIAEFMGVPDETSPTATVGACAARTFSTTGDPNWTGWGADLMNTRFQPTARAGMGRAEVPRLKLKWAFGFAGAAATYGQPTVAGGRVFVGSEDGTVYALDAQTGCMYWTYKAETTVKTAVSIDSSGRAAFFGDTNGNVYSVLAEKGSLLWKVRVDSHPAARITGSPVLVEDRLYVPVSSGEEGAAMDPKYPCCTFRGSVTVLDAGSGRVVWKTYTIPEAARLTGRRNSSGTRLWGPAGAAVWSPPTIDLQAHAVYVDTGNSYSDPDSRYSDAVVAFDMNTGKMLWSRQFTARDRWNIACIAPDRANCPRGPGNDFDFGAPPILRSLPDGRRVLIAGQKSGIVHALDPDHRGKIVWEVRIGHGGPQGGIQWGGGADESVAYFPRSDWDGSGPAAGGGLYALSIANGERVWFTPPPHPSCAAQEGCSAAQMAPVTVISEVVFSGSLDGHLRAYDTHDGSIIWDFDTLKEFTTVNGVRATGGSLNGSGPAIVDGMVYADAGYTNAISGNVLLAFSVDGK